MSYRSLADIGGKEGYGRVVPEPEGESWHAGWEPDVLALTLAMGATGLWNLDMSRSARETLPDYAKLGYYEIWFEALEKMLLARDLVRRDELEQAHALHPARRLPKVLHAADVAPVLAKGSPTIRTPTSAARFAIGDRVRTRSGEVEHHTRLPGYARGKVGRVEAVRGVHVFADANAHGLGEEPHWLYAVTFNAGELWGENASPSTRVSIDAWEPYLEPTAR